MNDDVHKALREHYKEEVDEQLFKGIHMEESFKQRILEQAVKNGNPKQPPVRAKPERRSVFFYKIAPVAAAAILMLVLLPTLLAPEAPDEPISQPELFSEEAPITEDAGRNETFAATEEPLVTFNEGPDEGRELLQNWHYETLTEAADAFEGEIFVPGLMSDGFLLKEIYGYGYGDAGQQPELIELKYENMNGMYFKIASSIADAASLEDVIADGYDRVELQHGQGYIWTDEVTHMKWTVGQLICEIEGNITKEEMLEIANHIEFYSQEEYEHDEEKHDE